MKSTLTGAAGNSTKPLPATLPNQGHTVAVIGSNSKTKTIKLTKTW